MNISPRSDITIPPAQTLFDTITAIVEEVESEHPVQPQPEFIVRNGDERRRVVITGMGAITALGNSVEHFWEGLVNGRSGLVHCTQFDHSGYPIHVAAEVKDFDPRTYLPAKELKRVSRLSQFAVSAAFMALDDARLRITDENQDDIGVLMGVGMTSLKDMEQQTEILHTRGGLHMNPFFFPLVLPNSPAGNVSRFTGARGYNSTICTACAASTQAIGEAYEIIRRGDATAMLAGGTEGSICELGLAGFHAMRALSQRNDPPEQASCPFDLRRDGFVAGEGAAMLVLEELQHAIQRQVPILAEVVGYGSTSDAYHIVSPDPAGGGAARAIRSALRSAGITPLEVDYINAHGTSTQQNDAMETQAIKAVFGEYAYKLPISATKSMIGHALGAAGALEIVACVCTIRDNIIHPTLNYAVPDPVCDLDYVPNEARRAQVDVVLSNSFGFGGQNACLIIKRYKPPEPAFYDYHI